MRPASLVELNFYCTSYVSPAAHPQPKGMVMSNPTEQDLKNANRDMNRDPISGAPGAHPVGTGVGATGGAVAGAAVSGDWPARE